MTPIRLKDRERELLRSIAHSPKTAHSLTHSANGVAGMACAPHVVRAYLDRLSSLGLIAPPARMDGKYSATDEGLELLAELERQRNVAPGTLICNASMPPGSYRPQPWLVREGGEDHRQFLSRGIGA